MTVNEKVVLPTVTSLTITSLPTKLAYLLNEEIDLTGLEVTANYSDETHHVIDNSVLTITGFDSSKVAEEVVVTITYAEKTVTFVVSVSEEASVPYAVSVNNGKAIVMEDLSDGDKFGDTWVEQYKLNLKDIKEHDIIEIKKSGNVLDNIPLQKDVEYTAAFEYNSDHKLEAITIEESINIYLKVYKDGTYKLFIPDADYTNYLRGSFNDWVLESKYAFTITDQFKDGKPEFVLKDVVLKAEDQIKVFSAGVYFPENNYVVAYDGTYDIYFVKEGGVDDWLGMGDGYFTLVKHPEVVGMVFDYHGPNIVAGHSIEGDMTLAFEYDNSEIHGLSEEEMANVTFYLNDDLEHPVSPTTKFPQAGEYKITAVYEKGDVKYTDFTTVTVIAAAPATSVEIAEGETLDLLKGRGQQLHATVVPEDTTDTVAWTSSNDKVVAVDKNGNVLAVGVGEAKITATAGEFKDEITINVALGEYVKYGDEKIELALVEDAKLANDQVAEYAAQVEVANDEDKVSLYLGSNLVTQYGQDSANDPVHNTKNNGSGENDAEGLITIAKAGNVEIYVKTWNDGGVSYWVTGGEQIHSYGVVGSGDALPGWDKDNPIALSDVDGLSASVQLELKADDAFKVILDKSWDNALGYAELELSNEELQTAFKSDGSGNIVVKYDALYTIIVNYETGKVDITGNPTIPTEPEPETKTVVDIYIKGEGTDTWLTGDPIYFAEVVIGDDTVIMEITYISKYDEGTTVHYQISVDGQPSKVTLYRCDSTIVTELPSVAPTEGILQVTNQGTIVKDQYHLYVDLSIVTNP